MSALQRMILEEPLSRVVLKPLVSLKSQDSLRAAIDLMVERKVGCIAVVENEKLIGIFTERDVLHKIPILEKIKLPQLTLSEFMTPEPETISPHHQIAFALTRMSVGGYRHLPIVEHDRLVGIVSIRDIFAYLLSRTDK